MITIKKLFKNYRMGKEKIKVLQDINLEIKQGEFVSILGPSGCGKSTLLNIVGGLDHSVEGEICFEKADMRKFREKDWIRYRKQKVGFIFQNFNLIEHLSAQENVELAMKFNGIDKQKQHDRAKELLDMVGLSTRISYLPAQLSGGQKQRVAIARALANHPEIILADEPTGALDSKSAREVMEIIHRINRDNGVTVVMVTHNRLLAEEADRIIYMEDGKVVKVAEVNSEKRQEENVYTKNSEKVGKMSFISATQVGIRNIWLKKKRSLLTVFGTAIGITGMILMLGIGIGADEKAHQELRAFVGDETIWVSPGDTKKSMTEQDVEKLKQIDGVAAVLDNNLFLSTYYYENKSAEGQMDAFGPRNEVTDYEIKMADKGTIPKTDDSNEIVLTSQIADELLNDDTDSEELIGKQITVLTKLILNHSMTYEVETNLTVTGISDTGLIAGASFIPYETARKLAEQSARTETFQQKGAEVRAKADASYDDIVKQIRDMGYQVENNKEDFSRISAILLALKAFLVFVAGVAMFVSAIMIKIVLQTSVIERTREIGVMCAIGAGKKEIKRIFVVEAGLIGLLSGMTGIAIGQILGMVLNRVIYSRFHVENFQLYQMKPEFVLMGLGISVVIAVLAGMKPAKRAAKIQVAEALRYE